jgi:hypothetical protein
MRRWIGKSSLLFLLVLHVSVLLLWGWSMRYHIVLMSPWPGDGTGIGIEQGVVTLNRRWAVQQGVHSPRLRVDVSKTMIVGNFVLTTDPFTDAGFLDLRQWCCELTQNRISTIERGPLLSDQFLRVRFPAWFAATLTGVTPWAWLSLVIIRCRRDRRRSAKGLCPKCGYDIRANPARCSECGHEVARAAIEH